MKTFGEEKFKIGEDDDGKKLRVKFKYFYEYLKTNKDDSPLYLFESSLENKKGISDILNHFEVPKYFEEDFFTYCKDSVRPPHRWLLMGPERSGTSIHIDPLLTSAWNTTLFGYKKWIMFPPEIPKSIVKAKIYPHTDEEASYFFL